MREAITDYATIVSGRFYDEKQLAEIAELVAEADCLPQEMRSAMTDALSSPALHRCENEEDCRNLLLLYNMQSERETEVLFLQKKIESLKLRSLPASRSEWLRLVHTDSLKDLPDKALFCLINQDEKGFLKHITPLADRYDVLGLKLLAAFYRKNENYASETYYLSLYEKVVSERYYDEPSPFIKARLRALSENGFSAQALKAEKAVLSDFFFTRSRIGF